MALANAVARTFPSEGKKFHYVYLSGHFTCQDQERPLYIAQEIRKLKVVDLHIFLLGLLLIQCR